MAADGTTAFPVQFTTMWSGSNRPENPWNLGGAGEVVFDSTTFRVRGKKSGTLWGGTVEEYSAPLESLLNVTCEKSKLRFEMPTQNKSGHTYTAKVTFWAQDEEAAAQIFARLPKTQTEEFATRTREEAEFEKLSKQATPHVFMTPALVAINVAVFAAMVYAGAGFVVPQGDVHYRWGSNLGIATGSGEWWRLFTSMFLHFGLKHLAYNMVVLWVFGAITERVYGNFPFLGIYLLSGVGGALASMLWHPEVNSAGASGAVFGVFGATLAYFLQHGTGVPRTVVASNIVAALFLVGLNLLVGLTPGTDNMAHLGGLLTGFVLGYGLARPLPLPLRAFNTRNLSVSATAVAGIAVLLITPMQHVIDESRAEMRYYAELKAYNESEKAAIASVKDIFAAAKARTLNRTTQANRLEEEVWKRYEEGYQRVSSVSLRSESPRYADWQRVVRFADNRRQGYRMMVDAIRANDTDAFKKADAFLAEGDRMVRKPK